VRALLALLTHAMSNSETLLTAYFATLRPEHLACALQGLRYLNPEHAEVQELIAVLASLLDLNNRKAAAHYRDVFLLDPHNVVRAQLARMPYFTDPKYEEFEEIGMLKQAIANTVKAPRRRNKVDSDVSPAAAYKP
jgi:hypothetical protein